MCPIITIISISNIVLYQSEIRFAVMRFLQQKSHSIGHATKYTQGNLAECVPQPIPKRRSHEQVKRVKNCAVIIHAKSFCKYFWVNRSLGSGARKFSRTYALSVKANNGFVDHNKTIVQSRRHHGAGRQKQRKHKILLLGSKTKKLVSRNPSRTKLNIKFLRACVGFSSLL